MAEGNETSVRVGMIGAGRWAAVHRNALGRVGAELAGVLVGTDASAERVRSEWEVPATTDPQTFFSLPMEAVIVVSPNYLHAEHAVAALEADKHVLVEKPMATRAEDCQRILAAAQRHGKVVAVGQEMRVFTIFHKVKELLDAGEIGRPLHLLLDLWRRPHRAGAGGWKTDPAKIGNTILEEPIHYLDLARWYLGEPTALQAWANSAPGRESLWENLDVRLEFAGARALVTRSIAAYQHRVTLQLVGSEGAIRASWHGSSDMDLEPQVSLVRHNAAGTHSVPLTRYTGHAFDVPKQTRAFLDAIRGGPPPPATGVDGCAAVALCLAVERSLLEGSSVVALGS